MSIITNLCHTPHVTGIKNNEATIIDCDPTTIGDDYIVTIGASTGGDYRISFGDKNKQWDGKPMQCKATSNKTVLYARSLNPNTTVELTDITICTLEDWQNLQKLGLTTFNGDTMPIT